MSRREKINASIPESTGIAQALAVLIEKNRAQARELEALACLIDTEAAATRQREAEQAARLGEALGELAEAETAVEIETRKRIEAEEMVAGLKTAICQIEALLASIRTTGKPVPGGSKTIVADEVVTDEDAKDEDAPIARPGPGTAVVADVGAGAAARNAALADHGRDCAPAGATAKRTMLITIELDEDKAVKLEQAAVRNGFRDAAEFATHLALQAACPTEGSPKAGDRASGDRTGPT